MLNAELMYLPHGVIKETLSGPQEGKVNKGLHPEGHSRVPHLRHLLIQRCTRAAKERERRPLRSVSHFAYTNEKVKGNQLIRHLESNTACFMNVFHNTVVVNCWNACLLSQQIVIVPVQSYLSLIIHGSSCGSLFIMVYYLSF